MYKTVFSIIICIFLFTGTDNTSYIGDDFLIEGNMLIRYKGHIKIVNVPNYIKVIDDYAFQSNSDIYIVNLPNGLKHIGFQAFLIVKIYMR